MNSSLCCPYVLGGAVYQRVALMASPTGSHILKENDCASLRSCQLLLGPQIEVEVMIPPDSVQNVDCVDQAAQLW